MAIHCKKREEIGRAICLAVWLWEGAINFGFAGDALSRLTTPSSATAERGAVAAWWSEEGAYGLRQKVARRRRVQARNSSYRDARSSSLQRMVRRLHWIRTDARKEFRERRPDSRWMPKRECLESWDSVKARDGAKLKTTAMSRRSELLRVERVDVVGSR